MISTHSAYSSTFHFANEDKTIQHWRCVDLLSNISYFIVEFEHVGSYVAHNQIKIINSGEDLLSICNQIKADENLKLKKIALFYVGQTDESDNWKLINIVEIQEAKFDEFENPVKLYVTDDGKKHADFLNSEKISNSKYIKSLIKLNAN